MIKYKYNIMKSRDASLESISEESGFIIYLNNFLLQYRSTRHSKKFRNTFLKTNCLLCYWERY